MKVPGDSNGLLSRSPSWETAVLSISQIRSERPQAAPSIPIKSARGVTLTNFSRLEERKNSSDENDIAEYRRWVSDIRHPRPRQIHYLADWIARFARWNSIPKVAQGWFRSGFLQGRNTAFASWLRAGRAADRREYLDAVAEIITSGATAEPFSDSSFARWTRGRLAKWQKSISGAEFLALCDRITSIDTTHEAKGRQLP